MLSSVEVFAMALKMRSALNKQKTQKLIALEYTPPKDGTA
jgi:hypothetical protein